MSAISVPRARDTGVDAALQAQATARANAEQQQQFMKELMSWEKKVKVKDESLKTTQSIGKALPPVRNVDPTKEHPENKKPRKDAQDKITVKIPRKENPIPGGDFRAWDKFDVNKALEDVDEDEADEMEPDKAHETEVHRAQLMREHRAGEEKDRGNAQFKQGKYAAAIECYTRGIDFDPSSSVLIANRAMARLKMKRYVEAEADCTMAIELAPTYIKAWQRRATARAALQKLEEALQDYMMVLKIDPLDKLAKRDSASLPQRIADAKEKARLAFRPLEHAGDATTLSTVKTERTLHRIAIEEIGESDDEITPFTPASPTSRLTEPHKIQILEDAEQTAPASGGAEAVLSSRVTSSPMRKIQVIEDDESNSDDDTVVTPLVASLAAAVTKVVTPTAAPPLLIGAAVNSKIAARAPPQSQLPTTLREQALGSTQSKSTRSPPKKVALGTGSGKTTPIKFETAWRRCDSAAMLLVLQSITPAQLPALIKHNLCAELVTAIFRALNEQPATGAVDELGVLEALTKTRRFDQTLMFLDGKELEPLRSVLAAVRLANGDTARLGRVESMYNL